MARKVTIRRGLLADLPLLDIGELGFAIDTLELYIGSETGNVLFARKNELEELNEEINLIKQSDVYTRLGISVNGLLTIDGIEQSASSGGEEMTLIVKDYFEGSSNVTKTYTEDMVGFDISNDHATTGLTFTINGLTIPVKANESYSANFAPYRSLSIATTIPYRATVSAPLRGIAPDTTAPNNITGLTATNITQTNLTLSWNTSTSTDTVEYDVYQGSTLLSTITSTTYNATGLSASTNYTFTVKAKDGSGNIATGTSVTVSTLAPDLTPPNEVANLTISNITATSLTLSWTASTSTDIANYEVYNGSTLLTTVTGTNYNVSGLSAQTNYTFRVKAKDASNNVSTGVTVNATTSNIADTTAPNNVTNLTTSNLSNTSVTLNWTASSSSDIASYDIYRNGSFLANTANNSYAATSLTEKTQYTFSVRAKDGAGNVAAGTEVTVTTLDLTAPANVTSLASSNITQTGVTLTWTASTSNDVANYQIYKDGANIGQASGTEFIVSGLTAATQYNFVVKSKDASLNESTGTSINVTTTSADTTAPTLTITPSATFTDSQQVTMSTNETATIYYTLDDTDPKTSGTRVQYTAPLTLTETDTVKAYAVDTVNNESAVQTVTYTKETAQVYVNDASLTYIQTTQQSNEFTIPNPENYFNGTGQWTIFSTMDMTSNANWLRRENEADTTFRVSVKLNTSNQMAVTLRGKTSANADSWITIAASASTVVDVNRFAHVVLMRDATNIKLYIDNVLVAQSSNVASTTSTTDSTGVKPLKLGEGTWVTFKNAGYYNRALTTEELTQNYNALK